jgi:phosphatidylserine/phosphatidylglycerophosphate/cardiolipin synthase-like enzyme
MVINEGGVKRVFEIVSSPWERTFTRLLHKAKKNVYLASPFIKSQTASLITDNINSGTDFRYINSFKLAHFHNGASDLDALSILMKDNCKQKNVPNLHAKLFIFDDAAIITSGNLTPGGLRNNLEYGILVRDALVTEIKHDYLTIFNNPDYPKITSAIINKAQDILSTVPKEKRKKMGVTDKSLFKEIATETDSEELYDGGIESVISNLTAWKKDVYTCLTKILDNVFTLRQVYAFEKQLSMLHPNNRNVQEKIRQQLQYLRVLGLVEFLEGKPGVYRKLWT